MWAYLSVGLVTMVLCGYQHHHGMREKDIYNIELLRNGNGWWGGWRGGWAAGGGSNPPPGPLGIAMSPGSASHTPNHA